MSKNGLDDDGFEEVESVEASEVESLSAEPLNDFWDAGRMGPTLLNLRNGLITNSNDAFSELKDTPAKWYKDVKFSDDLSAPNNNVKVAVAFSDISEDSSLMDKMKNGGFTLEGDLKKLVVEVGKKNTQGNTKLLIPITQSRKYMFGLITRAHWTLLELDFKDGQVVKARHIDPKGRLSGLYGLGHIKTTLNAIQPALGKNMETAYLGHQGIMDNTNCGRFCLTYISKLAENVGCNLRDITTEIIKNTYASIYNKRDNLRNLFYYSESVQPHDSPSSQSKKKLSKSQKRTKRRNHQKKLETSRKTSNNNRYKSLE